MPPVPSVNLSHVAEGLARLTDMFKRPSAGPSIFSISPTTGSTLGTSISIFGSQFSGATSVTIGGLACTSVVITPSLITCVSPSIAAGVYDVRVETPGGVAVLPAAFTAGFSPLDVVSPTLWLRADLGITLNGSNVSAWADQSPAGDSNRNAVQATSSKQPPFVASNANFSNRPTVNCTTAAGIGRYLFADNWAPPNINGDITVFVVARRGGSMTGNAYLWDGGDPSGGVQFASYDADGAGAFYSYSTAGGNYTSKNVTRTAPCVTLLLAKTGQPADIYLSSSTPNHTTHSDPLSFSPDGLCIGCYENGGPYSDFEIAEFAVWLRQITAPEIAALNAYASARYGITIS